MKIGVTGHQERAGIDWHWVRENLGQLLYRNGRIEGYSSLAVGTDQIFARIVLEVRGTSFAVIPFKNYRECFDGNFEGYDELLVMSEEIHLNLPDNREQSFLDAGKWIVRSVDRMIAVWDGEPAEGKGGTGDIVRYAASMGKPLDHLDPLRKIIIHR